MVFRLLKCKALRRIVLVACLATVLAACGSGGSSGGGGDGSGTINPADNSSNWDTLTWDQNNWL